jgi:FdhD protein
MMLSHLQERLMELSEKLDIFRLTDGCSSTVEDLVTKEYPLSIVFNNKELVTMLCSPIDLNYLAVGFLASEGLIKSRDEIKRLVVNKKTGMAWVETTEDVRPDGEVIFKRFISSGCGRGASFYHISDIEDKKPNISKISISAVKVSALMKDFQHSSQTFQATGGVHSAALYGDDKVLVFAEDIGRHNAIDKIFGRCMLEGIDISGRIIITSGRISSEILLKVAKRKIPILISRSAPTDLGVQIAQDLGITLIGFVRGKRMNVYTHNQRIKVGDGQDSGLPQKNSNAL